MTIRSRMSSIILLIGQEHLELFALEIKQNCYASLYLHSTIHKYPPINAKLGQNIYDYKILDEFDYGSNRITTNGVNCP